MGKHVYANFYNCTYLPSSLKELEDIVREAARRANASIVSVAGYEDKEEPHEGFSVVVIVAESHIAVHTWTRERYVTVDAYTCGEHTDPNKAVEYLIVVFQPEQVVVSYADRSSSSGGY